MEILRIDSKMMAKMFLAGAKNLEAKKEWINELNVFPVPDGDTGTNMCMTIMSAAGEVNALEALDMVTLCKKISSGSLKGARGNSGVILSQLFRGFTKVASKYDELDAITIAEAMEKGVETAYKAVMKPKEGTILTVARGAAEKALASVGETDNLVEFLDIIIKEAEEVLARTPDMLPVLKEAGVVDSGGQGLLEIMKGAYDAMIGRKVDYSDFEFTTTNNITKISPETESNIKFGYCTEFIIVNNRPLTEQEIMDTKAYLSDMGDSIVLVADDDITKIHVHTNHPGKAIEKALTFGSLSKIKIDNMREEHQEKLIKDAEKVAAQQKLEYEEEIKNQVRKPYGFISVSMGSGLDEIFKGLGVDYIISGGQTMNPSTEDMLNAIDHVNADTIYILPNNGNIIMAANQAATLCEGKDIYVIPTKTIPQAVCALINFIPEMGAKENADVMTEQLSTVSTGQITYAIRDTEIEGVTIKENDFMGICDSHIITAGIDMKKVIFDMVDTMVDEESSIITIYYGDAIKKEEAEELQGLLEDKYEDCEVEVYEGNQPIYYYIISVE